MKYKTIFLLASLGFLVPGFAQDEQKEKAFQLGIVPSLSLNGREAAKTVNHFSANLLWGVSAGVAGFEANGIGNNTFGSVNGYQASGLFNSVEGDVQGFQAAGFMNITGRVRGTQIAGFMNITGDVEQAQIAGFMNIVNSSVLGFQGAGFMNINRSMQGLQLATFMNISETVQGLQYVGFMNIAESVEGLQYAGFMNIAGKVKGMQSAGFMNIADKVDGVMMAGFLNIAEECDYPIGPVNIIENGRMRLVLSANDLGAANLSFKSGNKTYGVVGAGYNEQKEPLKYHVNAALGFSQPLMSKLVLHLEAGSAFYIDRLEDENDLENRGVNIHSIKALFDVPLTRRIGLYAAPTLNYMVTNRSEAADLIESPLYEKTCDCSSGRFQKLFLGAEAGVYFSFK